MQSTNDGLTIDEKSSLINQFIMKPSVASAYLAITDDALRVNWLWAMMVRIIHAASAAKRPDGMWLRPTRIFEVPDHLLAHRVTAVVGFQFPCVAVAVGDERVVVVGG